LPVCAVGVVHGRGATPTTSGNAASSWVSLHAETGGDFNTVQGIGECLPEVASVYLEPSLVTAVVAGLRQGLSLGAAIRAALNAPLVRLFRWSPLDVMHDEGLRVLQVVTSLQRGGAERIALDLTTGLSAQDIRTRLLVLGKPTRAAFPKPPGTIDLSDLHGSRAARWPALRRAVSLHAADLIHCHLLEGEDVASVAALGLPVVVTVHNMRQGWPRGMDQLPPQTVSLMLACSRAVETDLHGARLPHPIRTIWNGIDFTPYSRTPAVLAAGREFRSQLGFAPDDFVLVALANPRPQKRLDRLPAVLAATRAAFARNGICREARLLIVGEASNSGSAARQAFADLAFEIDRLGLADHVRMIGSTENVAAVLAAAEVLVSMSAYEGLSLAHLEALAAGLQVVATDAGGTAEIAHNNPAIRVVSLETNADRFAAELVCCATAPSNDWRAAAVDFSQKRMIDRHVFLYPRAIEAARSRRLDSGLFLVINNFSTGGAQSSARRLLLGLAGEGVRVSAAVLQEDANNPTPGLKAMQAVGVPVVVLPRVGKVDPVAAVCQLLEHIDDAQPAAVVLWNVVAQYKLLLADALLDVPLYDVSPGEMYYTSLASYFARPRPGLPYRQAREYGARLAGVIVKYHQEASQAENYLGSPVHVIPNGVPIGHPTRREHHNGGPLRFGTTARISPQKKLDELLAAFRKAHDRLPHYVLQIAGGVEQGSAAYAEELHKAAEGLPVQWVGELGDVRPFLRTLDVFALVAEPAGCPNSSLEAMAEGLPVIATDVGGMNEQVVNAVTGRLVPRGDAASLADALIEAAGTPDSRARWGVAARSRIADHFAVERMIADYRRVCLERV
jgi:glycosyltransferase involved in cell wall biosynthesis